MTTTTTSRADVPAFTSPDQQPWLNFLASEQRLLIGGDHSNGELALLEADGRRGHTAPRHLHRHATETFIVLSGNMLIDVGGQIYQASAGHVALLPRQLPHTFLVTSEHARYLTLHTPAGFEAFVRDVSDASHDGASPDRAALVALAATHGIDILGPGMRLDEHVLV